MTESAVVHSSAQDPVGAARELCGQLSEVMGDEVPDVMVLFASPSHDQAALLCEVKERCRPKMLLGASSAGEFTSDILGDGLVCALALRSTELRFSVGIGRRLSQDTARAARELTSTFRGLMGHAATYHSALILTDALAGHAQQLVEQLTLVTGGKYQLFGGGAGDDAQFRRTQVFFEGEALQDAVVGLEILSDKPVGVGVEHGWQPVGKAMRVTETRGKTLVSLDGLPAAEAFEAHAEVTEQSLSRETPMAFFLHNILGIDTGGGHRLRVPLAIHPDGSVLCASEIPLGSTVHLMRTTERSAIEAASRATDTALQALHGRTPQVALFFDCVATRLRMGDIFGFELEALAHKLKGAEFVGCNTHGQIARAEGQFSGFHNCTAVVCILPE